MKPIFALHPIQSKQIDKYCFGQCNNFAFGILTDEIAGCMYACRKTDCDFEKEVMEWDKVDNTPCYIRKLID